MLDGIQSALAGLARADARMMGASTRLQRASDASAEVDVPTELVNLRLARTEQRANVAVLRATEKTLGTLVDLFA